MSYLIQLRVFIASPWILGYPFLSLTISTQEGLPREASRKFPGQLHESSHSHPERLRGNGTPGGWRQGISQFYRSGKVLLFYGSISFQEHPTRRKSKNIEMVENRTKIGIFYFGLGFARMLVTLEETTGTGWSDENHIFRKLV